MVDARDVPVASSASASRAVSRAASTCADAGTNHLSLGGLNSFARARANGSSLARGVRFFVDYW